MSSALQTSRSVVDALGCADFASAAGTFACLCHQQRCSRVPGSTCRKAAQNRRGAVADSQYRCGHPAAAAITPPIRP